MAKKKNKPTDETRTTYTAYYADFEKRCEESEKKEKAKQKKLWTAVKKREKQLDEIIELLKRLIQSG